MLQEIYKLCFIIFLHFLLINSNRSKTTPKFAMIHLLVALSVSTISAQTTSFVSVEDKLVGYAEPEWFVANVPFLEVPDAAIEAVYYYRWTSLKRHLRYATPGAGYVITEFVHKVGYSQKFDTINAAAGHHIDEAKWLRNSKYVKVRKFSICNYILVQ